MYRKEFILRDSRQLCISEAVPEDADAIIRYQYTVGGETDFLTFGANEFWLSVQEETAFIRSVQERGKDTFLKGSIDGKIVSSLVLLRIDRPRIKHIGELGVSVLRDYWELGIGKYMCEEAACLAKQRGITKINLQVRKDNDKAILLYEKLGYKREGESSRAYYVQGIYYSQVLMGLEL